MVLTLILRENQTERSWHSARASLQSFTSTLVQILTYQLVTSVQAQEKLVICMVSIRELLAYMKVY